MKIKNNYVLQAIADEYLVVPIAEEADRRYLQHVDQDGHGG